MSDGWITEEMQGTIYYYYDKVLVANCKLRTLEPYAGKIARGSTVQLLVNTLETESACISAPDEISSDGDFYLAAPAENIIYQIHKNGTLIRTYAAAVSQVEETIMDVPMSILAMLRGKLLLHGAVISVWNDTYVVLGETEMLKCSGLPYSDTILLTEGMEGYKGIRCFRFGNKEELYGRQPVPKLKGILALQHIGQEAGVTRITETAGKEQLLLEHVVGFSMFSQKLQEDISNGTLLKEVAQKLPMAALRVSEGGKMQDDIDSYDFSILKGED